MEKVALLALIDLLAKKVNNLESDVDQLSVNRNKRGLKGRDGRDFDFEENQDAISKLLQTHLHNNRNLLKLKFSDLSSQEKDAIALTFDKLTDEQKDLLKGRDGKPFRFSEHKNKIFSLVEEILESNKDSYKLKFDDLSETEKDFLKLRFEHLSEEEKLSIRGARGLRGQKGRSGKDFNYSEHQETIEKHIVESSDKIIESKKEQYRLKFADLTTEEIDKISFKYSDFTDEQLLSIKGPRGFRGQKGRSGQDGKDGRNGPKGLPGALGPRGFKGLDGRDGSDASEITSVEIKTRENKYFYLVFYFEDNTKIETNEIKLPSHVELINRFISTGGGGSGSLNVLGNSSLIGVTENLDFIHPHLTTNYDSVTKTTQVDLPCINVFDEGNEVTECLKTINFVGDLVEVVNDTTISDWPTLSDVEPSMAAYEADNPGSITVNISSPDPANVILKDVTCDASVYVGAAVRMDGAETAFNALADDISTSQVIGIVESKANTTICDIRVLGVSAPNFIGLDVTKEYYLSDITPGALSTSVPTASGHVKIKLGQPFSATKLLVLKGEATIRA